MTDDVSTHSGTLDRDRLVTAYRELRRIVDVDPLIPAFPSSVQVFQVLCDTPGWDEQTARMYSIAARCCYQDGVDPVTGRPLAGEAAIHPVRVAEARNLVYSVLAGLDPAAASAAAARVVSLLADAGWRPSEVPTDPAAHATAVARVVSMLRGEPPIEGNQPAR
jgi:hypothetical protein